MIEYDIAIAGAGPAGSALALLATRAGYRVLLAEHSRFEKLRFGEAAPPELRASLARIGLDRLAHAPYASDAPELRSVWGTEQPISRNHILSPYGTALHLDRRAFDEALALAARDAGADLRLGCPARFTTRSGRGYCMRLPGGEHVEAQFAILATGRTGGHLGVPYTRRYLDDHVGVVAHFSVPGRTCDPRTLVEAVPGGWLYLAALPSESVIVTLMTSARLVPSTRSARRRWWLEALARSKLIRAALSGFPIPEDLSVIDARASYASAGGGGGWLAIGDARIAPDPLSGQGIYWAIDDAETVMALFHRHGWPEAVNQMQARTRREVEVYRVDRLRAYSSEQRFRADEYWQAKRDELRMHWHDAL
jgi:flavin-dependent dehydrogenase